MVKRHPQHAIPKDKNALGDTGMKNTFGQKNKVLPLYYFEMITLFKCFSVTLAK